MIFLNKLSISWINQISFDRRNILNMEVIALSDILSIKFIGLVFFNISNQELNAGPGFSDIGNIVEILHEYKEVNPLDLRFYAYGEIGRSFKHVLHFEGDVVIDLMCEEIKIDKIGKYL